MQWNVNDDDGGVTDVKETSLIGLVEEECWII